MAPTRRHTSTRPRRGQSGPWRVTALKFAHRTLGALLRHIDQSARYPDLISRVTAESLHRDLRRWLELDKPKRPLIATSRRVAFSISHSDVAAWVRTLARSWSVNARTDAPRSRAASRAVLVDDPIQLVSSVRERR